MHHHTESRDRPTITGASGSAETDSHVSDPRHCAFPVPHRAPCVGCALAPGGCRHLELSCSPPWLYGALPETFLPFSISLYFFYLLREDVGVENKWVLVSKYDFP